MTTEIARQVLLHDTMYSDAPSLLRQVLISGRPVRCVDDGIWSALPEEAEAGRYDARAAAYDRVVGSAIYNRLAWGASTAHYRAFARRAVDAAEGPLLDAGCGSAVFTAGIYANTRRPLVLVDRSLGMLQAARKRLIDLAGEAAVNRMVFLQADLLDLPFCRGSFTTVLSMGMLHLFNQIEPIMYELNRVARNGSPILLTSLTAERAVGRGYLAMLHRAGEVADPRTHHQLMQELAECVTVESMELEGSMTFITARGNL